MKQTPLASIHEQLGATMKEFAGYYMPIRYGSSIKDEHLSVRQTAGLFDISHMGEFKIKGEQAKSFLQRLTANDIEKLQPYTVQYTFLPNGKGGIIDDMIIYRLNTDEFMMVVNAANIKKDWDWIQQNKEENVHVQDISDETCLLAVQGPYSTQILQKLTSYDLNTLKTFRFCVTELAGLGNVLISKTGYTGEIGYEIYAEAQNAPHLWEHIMEAGKAFDIRPIGLGARDTLRLEAGLCLYGNDIDDTTSPLEAGLDWVIKFNDHNTFIDKDRYIKQKQQGIEKQLVGLIMMDKGIPRHNYEILDKEGNIIGKVTSGTLSPMLNKGIGMGYVLKDFAAPNTEIFIKIRKNTVKAKIAQFPLHKQN